VNDKTVAHEEYAAACGRHAYYHFCKRRYTVLTTTQAAKLVGCSNDLINSWMKKEDGLRFVRAQNGVFTTKEWLIDYFAHYTKEKNQDIAFQNKKHPKGIGEISDAFLVKKFLGISKNYLRFLAQHVIIRKIPNKNHKCLCLYKGGINLAGKRGPTPTKQIIIKSTSELFFENGFSKTTATELCKKANISTGNLTFYFPTKEHILADLVKMMCDFQWREMENAADEGRSSLLAYCLELTTMVAVGEEIPQMYDFFIAAYAHQIPLDIIRANDVEKIKKVFAEYTEGWDDERFIETEALISGIEYATLSSTEHSASMEHRIEGALNTIMMLFDVPEETRKMKVAKVLAMDYRAIGRKVYENFKRYVTETNEHNLEEISKSTKAKSKK